MSSVLSPSRLPLPLLVTDGRPRPSLPSPSPTLIPRADHRVPTANMTHISRKIIFTTGAHREGLFCLLSSRLCFCWTPCGVRIIRNSPTPSRRCLAQQSPLRTCHPVADPFTAPPPRSSRTFHLVPQLPRSRRTFATCTRADLINASATACPQIPQHVRCRPTYAAPHQPRCAPLLR